MKIVFIYLFINPFFVSSSPISLAFRVCVFMYACLVCVHVCMCLFLHSPKKRAWEGWLVGWAFLGGARKLTFYSDNGSHSLGLLMAPFEDKGGLVHIRSRRSCASLRVCCIQWHRALRSSHPSLRRRPLPRLPRREGGRGRGPRSPSLIRYIRLLFGLLFWPTRRGRRRRRRRRLLLSRFLPSG